MNSMLYTHWIRRVEKLFVFEVAERLLSLWHHCVRHGKLKKTVYTVN